MDLLAGLLFVYLLLRSDPLRPAILASAARYGLPPCLIEAIARVESGGSVLPLLRWEEKVRDWACGPMQIRYRTAVWLGFKGDPVELSDPVTSLRYGAMYLRWQLDRYAWDYERAISAYNAGTYTPANREYVERVFEEWRRC